MHPQEKVREIRIVAFVFAGISLIASLAMLPGFNRGTYEMQFVERFAWIPSFGVQYFMGVDGLSYPLVLLTAFMCVIGLVGSLGIQKRIKEYFFGSFFSRWGCSACSARSILSFSMCSGSFTLVPMYFLIGVWGGPRKEFAAIKFFLYTLTGSVFMLLAILALYFASPAPHTFDILELAKMTGGWDRHFQILVFLGLYFGMAIKIPAFPFHTWLPLAHVEAPTAISVILAAVLLKMGVYGLLRISYRWRLWASTGSCPPSS